MNYLLIFLFAITSLGATEVKSLFLTEEGKPTKALIELLSIDGLYDPQDTLTTIQKKTQEAWIAARYGADGIERCDLNDSPEQKKEKLKVIEAAKDLGIFNASSPSKTHYTYAIVLGGFREGILYRLKALINLWQQGTRFDSLYFLSGERPLRADKDGEAADCKTEYDLCKHLWKTYEVPQEMREALDGKVFFVNAPRDDKVRPGTKEIYETWLKTYQPDPGSILACSHPLYWTYQQLSAQNVLGNKYPLETIAQSYAYNKNEQNIVSLVHDTVAKCLYELTQGSQKTD